MSWPRLSASDESVFEETPWASAFAGISLETGEEHPCMPWYQDDVGEELLSPIPCPMSRQIPMLDQQHRSPFHLLVPAGPSPPSHDAPSYAPPRAPQRLYHRHHQHHHEVAGSSSSAAASTSVNADAALLGPHLQPLAITRASTRTAHLELLVTTRRAMEVFNDAVETVRSSAQGVLDVAGKLWAAATSRTAQRTVITTVAFAIVSGMLFAVACLGYAAFYHYYLPDQITTLPVHLQYGYELNPYGVVCLENKNFGSYQDYDISVTLNLPRSPANLDRGNFMLALHLLDNQSLGASSKLNGPIAPPSGRAAIASGPSSVLDGRNVLHTSTRTAIVPYTDPLVSLASRLFFLAYHMFVPASETTKLEVPMVERLEFRPGSMAPTQLVLDVQAGQTLQVYSATVTITAQLRGLRFFMHSWWVTSFVLFTALFWFCEVFFLGVGFLALKFLIFGGSGPVSAGWTLKKEETDLRQQKIKQEDQGSGRKQLEDVPMTFPTSSGQPPLRYEPPQSANGVDADVTAQADLPPAPGGEADDEYEDAGAQEYDGLDEARERDSGIGTSYSERDGPPSSLRRRASRGGSGTGL